MVCPASYHLILVCLRLEQLLRIYAVLNELCDALYCSVAVSSVSHAEPLRSSVENFASSSAVVDELVDHERDVELDRKSVV